MSASAFVRKVNTKLTAVFFVVLTATTFAVASLFPNAAQAAGCPVGDGPATWGDGKVCPDPNYDFRVHYRDKLTDGYCVLVKRWSSDRSAWVQEGPKACTTGEWVTFGTNQYMCGNGGARLYREDGRYFTMPNTAC